MVDFSLLVETWNLLAFLAKNSFLSILCILEGCYILVFKHFSFLYFIKLQEKFLIVPFLLLFFFRIRFQFHFRDLNFKMEIVPIMSKFRLAQDGYLRFTNWNWISLTLQWLIGVWQKSSTSLTRVCSGWTQRTWHDIDTVSDQHNRRDQIRFTCICYCIVS